MVTSARRVRLCITILGCAIAVTASARSLSQSGARQKADPLPFAIGDARAIVLYFIASDCPVSNRTLPEMLRIEHNFATRRVRFFFVYPNTTETPATIRTHHIAYGIGHNTITDPHETLAKLTGASVTPEAAVLIPSGSTLKSVYIGRIDDRYLSLGTERPAATHHDLDAAITAVLDHNPVPPPGGPPIGCAFMTLATK